MFAVLFFERDPFRLEDVPAGIVYWVQTVGGFAMVGLLAYLAIGWTQTRPADRARVPRWQYYTILSCTVLAGVFYLLLAPFRVYEFLAYAFGDNLIEERLRLQGGSELEVVWMPGVQRFQSVCLFCAGLLALVAVGLPFAKNIVALSWRRIFALSVLSFKEAMRRRILYAFVAVILVYLFGRWFVSAHAMPKDELRNYVQLVFGAATPLLLTVSVLVAAFSIPADIKQQTIHTILTKPVERFEVFLGRVLGFTALMTLVLLFLTGVSLLYVLRGVDPEAAAETLKARAPYYGDLTFENIEGKEKAEKGENVGEEWGYRSYIAAPVKGQNKAPMTAVWSFPSAPATLAAREKARCEFTFAIYRTTKGYENQGINCKFIFQTWRFDPARMQEYQDARDEARRNPKGRTEAKIADELARKFGYYEVESFPVENFVTLSRDVPGGLFANANEADAERTKALKGVEHPPAPVEVRVRCLSQTQYVGMAKYDLYFRLDDPGSGSEPAWFAVNFIKGAVGLWIRLCLVIGVATALSTYLSNVISLIVTFMLYVSGLAREFIFSVIQNKNVGGGPLRSFLSLVGRQIGMGPAEPPPRPIDLNGTFCSFLQHDLSGLDQTTGQHAAAYFDGIYRWGLARVFDLIPDVDRLDLTPFVAEGFDVSFGNLLVCLLILVAYLLPWAVLAYYLLKWREIASST